MQLNSHIKTRRLRTAAIAATVLSLLLGALPCAAEPLAEEQPLSTAAVPIDEYPLGSFFTKNGRACDCHNTGVDCIASGKDCNCMRYWSSGDPYTCEIDLLGVQCIGFARFCQYRMYKAIDYGDTAYRFYNVLGKSLTAWSYDAHDVEEYIKEAGAGAHIRIGTHSIIVWEIYEDGFVTYECNGSSPASACKVFSRVFTWEDFYLTYRSKSWKSLNVIKKEYDPTNTPDEEPSEGDGDVVTDDSDISDEEIPQTSEPPAVTEPQENTDPSQNTPPSENGQSQGEDPVSDDAVQDEDTASGDAVQDENPSSDDAAQGDNTASDDAAQGDNTASDDAAQGENTASDDAAQGDNTASDDAAQGENTASDDAAQGENTASDDAAQDEDSSEQTSPPTHDGPEEVEEAFSEAIRSTLSEPASSTSTAALLLVLLTMAALISILAFGVFIK